MSVKNECVKCGNCCRGNSGPFIFPSDVPIISAHLSISPQKFLNKYCTHYNINIGKKIFSIYLLKIINAHCVFLNHNLCEVYIARPYQCKNAPFNFMPNYELWKHMSCVSKEDFFNCDSIERDFNMFEQIISIGYDDFL